MVEKRFTIQGFRDYRGVQLPDLIDDLKEYRDILKQAVDQFQPLKAKAEKYAERLDEPEGLIAHIDFCISLFSGHWEDLKRLVKELPFGVKEEHIANVNEIYESCKFEEKTGYRDFKDEFICRTLKDESLRDFLDDICHLYGQSALGLLPLKGLNSRLRMFLGHSLDDKSAVAKKLELTSISGIEIPPDTRWEDLKLTFQDYDEIQIFVKGKLRGVKSYKALGFLDRRSAKKADEECKPTRLWRTLALFARCRGELSWDQRDPKTEVQLVKNVSDLRRHLKKLFGIPYHPIAFYQKDRNRSYNARFEISPIDSKLFARITDWIGGPRVYNIKFRDPNEDS